MQNGARDSSDKPLIHCRLPKRHFPYNTSSSCKQHLHLIWTCWRLEQDMVRLKCRHRKRD